MTGLSVSALVRKLIAGTQLRPRPPDQYAALMGKVDELAAGFSAFASRLEAARPGTAIPDTTTPADDAAIL